MTRREKAIAAQREQLAAAIASLQSEQGWKAWILARTRFHAYSFRNQILIAIQHPGATYVRGYRQWQNDFNRQVRSGEKAIWILAPSTRKVEPESDDDDGRRVYFRSVKVFDVSQTDPIPGEPEIPIEQPVTPAPIEGDSHAHLREPLERHATSLGLTVLEKHLPAGNRGHHSPSRKEIVLNQLSPPNEKVATLVHELAHAHGIDYTDYSRADAEAMAETASYLACHQLGLDTSSSTIPYIASWCEKAPDVLSIQAQTINTIAELIAGACETTDAPTAQEGGVGTSADLSTDYSGRRQEHPVEA